MVEDFVLGGEVVIEEAVRDTRLLRDVSDPRGVEALPREHAGGRVEDQTPLLLRHGRALRQGRRRVVVASALMQALGGSLVIDLTRYLPGAFASRELLRLGARVVRIEQPGGDPMRATAPEWHDELNAGKESVVCDLPAEAPFAQALLARADVVLESFRPGVAGGGAGVPRAPTLFSSRSGPAWRAGSGSAPTTRPRASSIARSRASGRTRREPATISTTSAGPACSRRRGLRFPPSRLQISRPARSARSPKSSRQCSSASARAKERA